MTTPKANKRKMTERGTLKYTEPHPAFEYAREYLMTKDLLSYVEAFASCAIEGNRLAEVCSETLHRLLNKQPVSDRYFMGLAWAIWQMEENKK